MEKNNFNPFNSSPLPDKLKLVKKETTETFDSWTGSGKKIKVPLRKFEDSNSGDEYLEKILDIAPHRQNPTVEHFVSLLTKGVLHSSDFIEKDGTYYSRKMNLENADPVRKGELEAELFLLRYAFCDWDKLSLGTNVAKNNDSKFAHYDYAEAFGNFWRDQAYSPEYSDKKLTKEIKSELRFLPSYGEKGGLKRSVIDFLTNFGFPAQPKLPEAENELQKKSEIISEQIKDDGFWNAIIDKSGLDIMGDNFKFLKEKGEDERLKELRNFMILRLDLLVDVLKQRNGK